VIYRESGVVFFSRNHGDSMVKIIDNLLIWLPAARP
jgi:hypothetical protein